MSKFREGGVDIEVTDIDPSKEQPHTGPYELTDTDLKLFEHAKANPNFSTFTEMQGVKIDSGIVEVKLNGKSVKMDTSRTNFGKILE